ncbi:MAG TPA: tryptophan synthase subunit alpha [Dermatophilaceae bacterium]|nr:tryptophan synthase subunit alpha [Dermatophilaceae bacterium]
MTTARVFERTRAEGRAALVGYLPAGFPDVPGAIEAMKVMVDAGCDIIEVGLPYSDPVMDGPTIQAAAQRALEGGIRTIDVLRTVEAVAATGTPTVVMTYWNPVEQYGRASGRTDRLSGRASGRTDRLSGVERFAGDLAGAGGAGLITPDLTPDSADEWIAAADKHDLDKIFLVAPSSTDERLRFTAQACRGFVYATAVMGVTGARASTSDLAGPLVARTRGVTDLPVGVGLGVSDGDQAAEVAAFADAVIVGSAFVKALLDSDGRSAGLTALRALTEDLAAGVRRA